MTNAPPVTIIIPNYNGAQLLLKNLPTVQEALQAYPGSGCIVVVDDGSSDDSIHVLTGNFKEVNLVRHERNLGFAEAIHSGVRAAATEFMIFLNSDVQPAREFIQPLIGHFEDPGVFAVSPLIYEESGRLYPLTLNSFELKFGRLSYKHHEWCDPPLLVARPRPALYASGGSMAVRKSMFQELGGFLPIFKPFYWEDFDLGVRAWRRGWRILLEPGSVIVHQYHGSIKDNVSKKMVKRAHQRNKMLAEWIHLPVSSFIWVVPRILLRGIARTMVLDLGYWKALGEALRRLPEVRRIRRDIHQQGGIELSKILAEIEQENAQCR